MNKLNNFVLSENGCSTRRKVRGVVILHPNLVTLWTAIFGGPVRAAQICLTALSKALQVERLPDRGLLRAEQENLLPRNFSNLFMLGSL